MQKQLNYECASGGGVGGSNGLSNSVRIDHGWEVTPLGYRYESRPAIRDYIRVGGGFSLFVALFIAASIVL